jgi:hypothetical protein
MPIKVLLESIHKDEIYEIIDFYNKNNIGLPLEVLHRREGGFQINKLDSSNQTSTDANDKIKQLRWSRRYLKPYKNYEGFTETEELLLFLSMKKVLGENVVFEI